MSQKTIIEEGVPCEVIHFDKDGLITTTEKYNLENYEPPAGSIERLARGLLPDILDFYADPKNQAAFEAWQADRLARGLVPPPTLPPKKRNRRRAK